MKKGKGGKKASKKSAAKKQKQPPDAKTADNKPPRAAKAKSAPKPTKAKQPKPKRQGGNGPNSTASSAKKKDNQPPRTAKPSGARSHGLAAQRTNRVVVSTYKLGQKRHVSVVLLASLIACSTLSVVRCRIEQSGMHDFFRAPR